MSWMDESTSGMIKEIAKWYSIAFGGYVYRFFDFLENICKSFLCAHKHFGV